MADELKGNILDSLISLVASNFNQSNARPSLSFSDVFI